MLIDAQDMLDELRAVAEVAKAAQVVEKALRIDTVLRPGQDVKGVAKLESTLRCVPWDVLPSPVLVVQALRRGTARPVVAGARTRTTHADVGAGCGGAGTRT